jgi:multidrug resistance efflux pump
LVYSVDVHSGDKVKKKDKLLTFDKDELYLKEAEALADINKYTSESEKARAKNSLADMRMALSKKKEAELNLERVHYYLKKSDILSPLTGVVIAGDKEELLGAPISKGDLLFKVAQSTDLYLKLKIPENNIDEINSTLKGEFALLSSPDKKYHFTIEHIIPMAEVDKSEGNVFVAKAKVVDAPENWWRAGMSGVAKIEVGERNILWILTHEFVEYLRLYFWI